MPSTSLVNLSSLIDDAKCYALVRQQRWPEGVRCPACGSATVIRDGRDDTQEQRQRYRCKACAARFDDLTGTVLAGVAPRRLATGRPLPAGAHQALARHATGDRGGTGDGGGG